MMKRKMAKLMLGAALLGVVAPAPAVMAWGPERPTYTNNDPANKAVFNSITDNAAVGDERDFVRIAEKRADATYVSDLTLEADKQYEVYIYYHNDASATYNDKAHNYVGVARDVRLASGFPQQLKKGERGKVVGIITATNTEPLQVWDEAYITAKEPMTLHYVEGTAKIYNQHKTNGSVLSTNLFTDAGTFLGINALNGVVLGCDEYSGQVVYTIQTKSIPQPEEPDEPDPVVPDEPDPVDPVVPDEPTPKPDVEPVVPEKPTPEPEPEVPTELPNTGPAEIILAVVIVIVIIAGVAYWSKTHRAVKHATKKARGRK